ncbi:MAG TPA: hypothetical protein VLX68_02260 [Chitinivibrionales bacterium]|nr:hypothetical protein [Chitinivibrionales bacterium]
MQLIYRHLFFIAFCGIFFSSSALVRMEIDTLNVRGVRMVVRASSCLQGPRVFSLANLFDNDSLTCWIEGYADTVAGRWFDITYPEKKRFRGMIIGPGCRQDYMCLADFGVPAAMRVKLDEKEATDRMIAWEWGNGSLAYADVNLRKAVLWFDSDTAFTTAQIRVKFTAAMGGRRYLNAAVSDFEPVDAYDNRFALLGVLTARSFNPNDLGAVHFSVFPDEAEPKWVAHVIDSVLSGGVLGDPRDIASTLNRALGAALQTTMDQDGIQKYMAALKAMLVNGPVMPRFVFDGPRTTYLLPIGSLRRGSHRIDVWRSVFTERTSKGLEVTMGYVSFVN